MKLTIDEAKRLMDRNGGSLYLRGTQITALPDGLTVGGSLDLRGTQITALPDGLTVGGYLYLEGTQITEDERRKVKPLVDGTIVPGCYIVADGRIFHYTGRHHKVGEYTVYVGKIKGQLLVSDGSLWAHCKTAREGISDIAFKKANDRGADQFKGLDIDAPRTVAELCTMYRIITGACRAGTEAFVASVRDLKETYSIREAVKITKGQYNSAAFARFFGEG